MENTPVYAFPTGHMDAPERYIQHIREEQGEDPVMSAGVTSRSFPALGEIGFDYYNGGTILEENGYTDYAFFSTVPRILSVLWGAGALVMLLCLVGNNLRFAARLRRSRRPLDIPQCPLPVYRMEGLSSPCLSGLFHPAIYLTPEVAENETALRHVLAHEGTHYAHKDHILVRPPVYRPGPPLV
ncbi:MAG: M56 family metallopeptidase [Oscillospiraceae bacterium]